MSATSTEELIRQAAAGDALATQSLLERHRPRLRRMIDARLDDRVQSRVDPSDIIQETIFEASRRLGEYLVTQPLPFYPWLRQIAAERLAKVHRQHVAAQKRSVMCEVASPLESDHSSRQLARQLAGRGTSPSGRLLQAERRQRVQMALAQMNDGDREILVLRHLEQLSIGEISIVLRISESAAKSRHFRAIHRLHELLGDEFSS